MVQTQRKLPKIRTPQTMFSTIFNINDLNLKDFMDKETGSERRNTLYENLSIIANYCTRKNCWVEHNPQAVLCGYELQTALDVKGFLWTDLPQILMNKKKICPATEREIMESGTQFPNPPTNSIPGASCDSPKTILDTEIYPRREYNIPTGFNIIFNCIQTEMTPEERARIQRKCPSSTWNG